jgi:hypothetical protein
VTVRFTASCAGTTTAVRAQQNSDGSQRCPTQAWMSSHVTVSKRRPLLIRARAVNPRASHSSFLRRLGSRPQLRAGVHCVPLAYSLLVVRQIPPGSTLPSFAWRVSHRGEVGIHGRPDGEPRRIGATSGVIANSCTSSRGTSKERFQKPFWSVRRCCRGSFSRVR